MSRAAAAVAELREVQLAAVARKQARRFDPVSYTQQERAAAFLEGRALPAIDWNAPPYAPPRDLGEWLDDRLTEVSPWPYRDPVTAVVFTIAAAAREGGPAAAAAAVRGARRLGDGAQYRAYTVLARWRGRRDGLAEALMDAVIREWGRLKLAEAMPDDG